MHRLALLNGLLVARPLAGRQAVLLGLGALAVPTLILSTDQSLPAGACCTTYFPFVMMSAIMMSPGYAATVALGSIGLADTLFMGPGYKILETPMDRFGDLSSLISFALIIGVAYLVRQAVVRLLRMRDNPSGVIFSLERGEAWASWPGAASVRLGPQEEVAEMMEDFLAQVELGKRLADRYSKPAAPVPAPIAP